MIGRLFSSKKSPEVLKLQEEILHFQRKLSKAARTDQERKAELLCLQKTIVRLQEEIKDFNFREGKGRLLEEIAELKARIRELEDERGHLMGDNQSMRNETRSLRDEVTRLEAQLQQRGLQPGGGGAYNHQSSSNQSSLHSSQSSYVHQSYEQYKKQQLELYKELTQPMQQQTPYVQPQTPYVQQQTLMSPQQLKQPDQQKNSVDVGSKEDISFWVVNKHEVELTDQRVGEGGWGTVSVGLFRGQEVAVKQLHAIIGNSDYCKDLVRREIGLMAKVRHPNLLLFIAAVLDTPSKSPIIITELMETNLRIAYENNRIADDRTKLLILKDVSTALNYLHLHIVPIVHRDVSSANVLLQALPNNHWRGKLSDFGSANLAGDATTPGPGAIAYSAPEALKRGDQSPKMDVYSYGVLFCEVFTSHFPYHGAIPGMMTTLANKWPMMHDLVQSCILEDPYQRPSMNTIVNRIRYFTKSP